MTEQDKHVRNEAFVEVQNIGLIDRLLRAAAAAVLIGQILFVRESMQIQSYLVLLGLYPAFTAMWGWDPLYFLADLRTCGRSPGSVCGTLTAQLDAALRVRRKTLAPVRWRTETAGHASTQQREASNEPASWDKAA